MRIRPWRRQAERPAGRLRSEMDRLFDRFLGDWWGDEPAGGGTWAPDLDVAEGEKDLTIRAEMPGLDSKDFRISIAGNVLTLSGEKREETEDGGRGYSRSEIRYGTFERTIELPETADPDRVTADYDKGVLTIRIGKKEGAQPRRIEVTSGRRESPGEHMRHHGQRPGES